MEKSSPDIAVLGIYIHFPFCISKCIHCNFYSVPSAKFKTIRPNYIEYLLKEINLLRKYFTKEHGVKTLYIGGGSPNLLTTSELDRLIHVLYKDYGLKFNSEKSIELNPGDIDFELLKKLKEIGINRLSFGIQSFNDRFLKFLRRRNSSTDNVKVFNKARELGYRNISIDLIFGIPGQSLEEFKKDLIKVMELKPEHISLYNLIYEKDTELMGLYKKGIIKPVNEDTEFRMYEYAHNYLTENGYQHYEVSNFSLLGYSCIHNLNYWQRGNYIGLGPSAHSFYRNRRWNNFVNIKNYIRMLDENKLPVENEYYVNSKDKIKEIVMLNLRLKDGVKISYLKDEVNNGENIVEKIIDHINEKYKGYIVFDKNYFKVNFKGWFILNSIIADIFYIIDEFYEKLEIAGIS